MRPNTIILKGHFLPINSETAIPLTRPIEIAMARNLSAWIQSGTAASYSVGAALAAPGSWFPAVAGNPPRTVSVAGLGCYEAWANGSLYMEQGNFDASGAYSGGCPSGGNRSGLHGRARVAVARSPLRVPKCRACT